MKNIYLIILLNSSITLSLAFAGMSSNDFHKPPVDHMPETWFHLIGGNVAKSGLTADLEAIKDAGVSGIQLFHGQFGGPWPGVEPQIVCLSPSWDDMISHVADECRRLDLRFTMQNCPGWAMSGGPWITPEMSMRELISCRHILQGGSKVKVELTRPEPSQESWRDYRDIAVLAFPTPLGADAMVVKPANITSNRPGLYCESLFSDNKDARLRVDPDIEPFQLDVQFDREVTLRSMELPSVAKMTFAREYDPGITILINVLKGQQWNEVVRLIVPRSNWQDDKPLTLAIPETTGKVFRIVFELTRPIELNYINLSSAAQINDWQGQGAYVLRSLNRNITPKQSRESWIKSDEIIDLTGMVDSAGILNWQAPDGKWTVLRFGHVNTGAKNGPAPAEATGFECNKLDRAGAEAHFRGYIGRITDKAGPVGPEMLSGMLTDSWECHTQTWTQAMEQEFTSRRGYPLRKWLPALAGWVVDDHLISERFLRDWRATINDLLVENYFGRLAELCHQRGMKVSFETAIGDVSPGDILQYYNRADIPMCEFWQPNCPQWGGLETKPILPAASATHIYGKNRLAAESFTNIMLRWDEHPFMLKHMADRHFALGVTHLVFHTYTHNPRLDVVPGSSFGAFIGTPFLRGQTWWKSMPLFTEYLARCSYMLEQGNPVADVLWYLGDELDHKPRQDSPFPDGYHFDYINYDALLNHIEIKSNLLCNKRGTSWQVLWLPRQSCRRLTPDTLHRLYELVDKGATIIASPPAANATLSGGVDNSEFTSIIHRLWGDSPLEKGTRHIGKGRLLWGYEIKQALDLLEIQPDIISSGSLECCHRRTSEADIYFVAAGSDKPLTGNVGFRSRGSVEIWDTLTGIIKPVNLLCHKGEHTYISLDLPAGGSAFVVFNHVDISDSRLFSRVEFNGQILADTKGMARLAVCSPGRVQGLTGGQENQPWVDNPFTQYEIVTNGKKLISWLDGNYALTSIDGCVYEADIAGTRQIRLDGSWQLAFPSEWVSDQNKNVTLDKLIPWSELNDPESRAFSGTAAYEYIINVEAVSSDEHVMLDLGKVLNIASVIVNGQYVDEKWAAPFRFDISRFLIEGDNTITVQVTNTWYNRLAYDASLPQEQQKTWTINGPGPQSKLQPAGLVGPVTIYYGKEVDITFNDQP